MTSPTNEYHKVDENGGVAFDFPMRISFHSPESVEMALVEVAIEAEQSPNESIKAFGRFLKAFAAPFANELRREYQADRPPSTAMFGFLRSTGLLASILASATPLRHEGDSKSEVVAETLTKMVDMFKDSLDRTWDATKEGPDHDHETR